MEENVKDVKKEGEKGRKKESSVVYMLRWRPKCLRFRGTFKGYLANKRTKKEYGPQKANPDWK